MPNLALFLSSIAKLQTKEEANLMDSGEVDEKIMELRWYMVSISARERLRWGFRERLKRMESERVSMVEEEDLERLRRAGMAASVCAIKFLFWGLTLVMESSICSAFCRASWESESASERQSLMVSRSWSAASDILCMVGRLIVSQIKADDHCVAQVLLNKSKACIDDITLCRPLM